MLLVIWEGKILGNYRKSHKSTVKTQVDGDAFASHKCDSHLQKHYFYHNHYQSIN